MWPRIQKALRHNNRCCSSVARRAALKLGQRPVYSTGVKDLIQGVRSLELCVWVALRVLVRHAGNFGEVFGFGPKPSLWVSPRNES